jgi:hypothetical protein
MSQKMATMTDIVTTKPLRLKRRSSFISGDIVCSSSHPHGDRNI